MPLSRNNREQYRFTTRFKIIIVVLMAALILSVLYLSIVRGKTNVSSKKTPKPVDVSASITKTKDKQNVTLSAIGVIVPVKYTSLYFKGVSGALKKLNISAGNNIKAGDVVASISPGDLNYQIERQRLEVQKARLKISGLNDEILSIQLSTEAALVDYNSALQLNKALPARSMDALKKAKLMLEQIQLQLTSAEKDKEAAETEYKSSEIENQEAVIKDAKIKLDHIYDQINEISKSKEIAQIDEKETISNQEEIKTDNLDTIKKVKIALQQLKLQLNAAEKNRQSAGLDLKGDKLELNDLENKLDNCRLISPITGTVIYVKKVSLSDFMDKGETIARVADTKNVVMMVSSKDLSDLSYSSNVSVIIGDRKFETIVYKPQPGELVDYVNNSMEESPQIFLKIENLPSDYKLNDRLKVKLEIHK